MTPPSRSALGTALRTAGVLGGVLGGVGVATLGYAAGYEHRAFVLRHVSAPVLAPGSRPVRILQVSDLHLTQKDRARIAWVQALRHVPSDLVVATGDFLAGRDSVPVVMEALEPLLERQGMFVPGNADYFSPVPKSPSRYWTQKRKYGPALPWSDLALGLSEAGWLDLTQARATVEVDGRRVDARGVDDPHTGRDDYAAVAGPADPAADLSLGLAHSPEPRVLDPMTRDGLGLLLAGHTHGGQVRIPGYGALVTNCGIDRARARGLARYGAAGRSTWLYVSAGLGTSPYSPVRFCCRPEATLLTLVGR